MTIEKNLAWEFIEHTNKSVFLTGKAGTGKTTFLRTLTEKSRKRMIVVAPTGVAAINAGGVTIHSFFQLPLSPFVPGAEVRERFDFSKEKRRILRSLDLLVIDEISMVRSDLLDAVDWALRKYRDRHRPFGGVQLLMIGDLQQLTPVTTPEDDAILSKYYATPYFFGSNALRLIDYVTIQLTHVYRQQDERFIEILNNVRDSNVKAEDLAELNARVDSSFRPKPDEGYIRLTTHNASADNYNQAELARLDSPSFDFTAMIDGQYPESAYPTQETLTLKEGAQVMFIKNDPSFEHRYFNGKIGYVTNISHSSVEVYCPGDDEAIEVDPAKWENTKYELNETTHEIEEKVLGTFTQFPLRLAWAVTIHKSQGLTFDKAIIEASASFAPGQVYVALSRCRSLDGIVLASPIPQHVIMGDPNVRSYISQQDEAARRSIEALPDMKEEYFRYLLAELFDFRSLLGSAQYLFRFILDNFSTSHPRLAQMWRELMPRLEADVQTVGQKWTMQINRKPCAELHEEAFLERVSRSAKYFADRLTEILDPVVEPLKAVESGNKAVMKRWTTAMPELLESYYAKQFALSQMVDSEFSINDYLHARSEAVLNAYDRMNPNAPRRNSRRKQSVRSKVEKTPKPERPDTKQLTLTLHENGLTIKEIAAERDLTPQTIVRHLCHFVASGELPVSHFLTENRLNHILRTIKNVSADNRSQLKEACESGVTYADIHFAEAELKRRETE